MAQEIGLTNTLDGLEDHSGFDADDRRAIETGTVRHLFPRFRESAGHAVPPAA